MKNHIVSNLQITISALLYLFISLFTTNVHAQLGVWATLPAGSGPNYVAVDASGNVYTQNLSNTTVSKITSGGVITAAWQSPANTIRGIAVDISGRVFVSSNTLGGVFVYSAAGTSLGTVTTGSGPQGIAADNLGNVYVANYSGGSVSKINSSLAVAAAYTISGSNGAFCICTDPSGNVYTANFALNTVSKITAAGVLTVNFASPGTGPHGICSDPSGNIYVANYTSGNVVELNPGTGAIVNTWTVGLNPEGICSDANGNIYVANTGSTFVSKISSAGVLTLSWGSTGSSPSQIAINNTTATLYVSNVTTGTISTNTTALLPVVLSAFTAQNTHSGTTLKWIGQQASGLGYFGVERASNGGNSFETIGKVIAASNNEAPVQYSYVDASPFIGKNDYRLAVVDLDGHTSYSEVKTIVNNSTTKGLMVWPSLCQKGQPLQLSLNNTEGTTKVDIFNGIGQVLWSGAIYFQGGRGVVPTQDLSPGSYYISTRVNDAQVTSKFIVQ